jgi:adenylosuccinate synthase
VNFDHGTVGVGINATVQRHKVIPLFARDLLHVDILKHKLFCIQQYYEKKIQAIKPDVPLYDNPKLSEFYRHVAETLGEEFNRIESDEDYAFIEFAVNYCQNCYVVEDNYVTNVLFDYRHHFIFEGHQGIMLDQDFGFAPYTTPSYCTSRNVFSFLKKFNITLDDHITTYYVTRTYATRHGNGPMVVDDLIDSAVDIASKLPPVPYEANKTNHYQGEFFLAELNVHQILYALSCDIQYQPREANRYIVMTCFDQYSPFPMLNTVWIRGIKDLHQLEEEINEELFGIHRMPKFWIKDVVTKTTPFTGF